MRQFAHSLCVLVALAGAASAQTTVTLPLDAQIDTGFGAAIYIPGGGCCLSFESDGSDGWTRKHMDASAWYGMEIDLTLAGIGTIDITPPGGTLEIDCRYAQDNANPYADAPIFLRLIDQNGAARDFGIVYQTSGAWQCDPLPRYPEWVRLHIDLNDLAADWDCDGNGNVAQSPDFDPTRVARVNFYGTDWNWVPGAQDWIDLKDMAITVVGVTAPPEPYVITPVLFVPDPASFPVGYQPSAAEIEEDLANLTEAMARMRDWFETALGQETSVRVAPVVHLEAQGGLADYDIIWTDPERRYRDGIFIGGTWGLVLSEVAAAGFGPGTAATPRSTIIFCKGAGGFAGGAQWYPNAGGGMCMLGDWCLDSLAERVPTQWWDWWTGKDRQTGAAIHEFGHTIGLPHPDAVNPSSGQQDYPYTVMGAWWDWPNFPMNPADPRWPLRGLHAWSDNDHTPVISDYQDEFLLAYRAGWFARHVADVDADGDVDLADLALTLTAFGRCAPHADYNFDADLNKDGCVDLEDLSALLAAYGYTG